MSGMPECLRCKTPMEKGFVADGNRSGDAQQRWDAGEPVSTFWSGLKVDRKHELPVITLRCPKCGMLESYANPAK